MYVSRKEVTIMVDLILRIESADVLGANQIVISGMRDPSGLFTL